MNSVKTGSLIAQARKEKALTQSDLAAALHVSTQAVSKWERGLNFPDITLLEPLGQLLDLTVSQLMAGERDTTPQEELLQESLRLGAAHSGRAKKWRRLFLAAAGLLAALLLLCGYFYVRRHTDWLPQRETVITPIEIDEMDALIARLSGQKGFAAYELTLADGLEEYGFRIERWTSEGLVESTDILSFPLAGWSYPRHQEVAFSFQEQSGVLTANIICGGVFTSPVLGTFPEDSLSGWGTQGTATSLSPENGAVLLDICINKDGGHVSFPADYDNFDFSDLSEGQTTILLRMFVK